MTLTFRDIEFQTKLPDVPTSMPLAVTETPCAPDRMAPMRALAKHLRLADAVEVETPFGFAFASKTGQVELLAASGAVRARNAALLTRFADERRDWPDVRKVKTDRGVSYALGDAAERALIVQAQETLKGVGLLAEGVASVDVSVGQWAQLDDKGREVASGPGRATVRTSYGLSGVPFIGPGAKTNLHYDPVGGDVALARLFHVMRPVVDVREVATGDVEQAFQAFLADPFLDAQVRLGGHVVVTSAQVGLLALPADTYQRACYPALAVEGSVVGLKDRSGEYSLRFARYARAVSPGALRRAGVAVPVLDGGRPAPDVAK
jgi:hypothetical protein